jgi:hypothetical protein
MIHAAAVLMLAALVPLDDKDDLGSAVKKLAEAKSYSFKGESLLSVPGRGDTAPAPTPTAFEGKFAEDVGLVVQTAQEEIVKIDGKTAVRPKAVWRVIDDGTRGNRGPGMQAAFAGRGGPGLLARAPKEDLAGIDGKLDKVTKSDKKETVGELECVLYEATFSADGAKSLAGGARAGGQGNGNAEVSASARFWVGPEGQLAKYEISSKVTRTFNNRDLTTSTSRSISLFDVGKTKVELPEGAKEAFAQK